MSKRSEIAAAFKELLAVGREPASTEPQPAYIAVFGMWADLTESDPTGGHGWHCAACGGSRNYENADYAGGAAEAEAACMADAADHGSTHSEGSTIRRLG